MAATEKGTTPNGEPNLSAAECTTITSDDQDSNYDTTLGLCWEDGPREGGVLSNAEVSIAIEGGVSAITSPEHYVPLVQIKVPPNEEVMINKPIVNSIIEETSSTHATTCSTYEETCSTYEERIKIAKRCLQAGLKVRFIIDGAYFL